MSYTPFQREMEVQQYIINLQKSLHGANFVSTDDQYPGYNPALSELGFNPLIERYWTVRRSVDGGTARQPGSWSTVRYGTISPVALDRTYNAGVYTGGGGNGLFFPFYALVPILTFTPVDTGATYDISIKETGQNVWYMDPNTGLPVYADARQTHFYQLSSPKTFQDWTNDFETIRSQISLDGLSSSNPPWAIYFPGDDYSPNIDLRSPDYLTIPECVWYLGNPNQPWVNLGPSYPLHTAWFATGISVPKNTLSGQMREIQFSNELFPDQNSSYGSSISSDRTLPWGNTENTEFRDSGTYIQARRKTWGITRFLPKTQPAP
jgi:hypothetical protein